jgi:hypothetical protein
LWSVNKDTANVTATKLCQREIKNQIVPAQKLRSGSCLVADDGSQLIMLSDGKLQLMNAKHEVKWSNPGAAGADASCELRESGSFVCTSDLAGVVDITKSTFSKIGLGSHQGNSDLTFGFQADGSLAVINLHSPLAHFRFGQSCQTRRASRSGTQLTEPKKNGSPRNPPIWRAPTS